MATMHKPLVVAGVCGALALGTASLAGAAESGAGRQAKLFVENCSACHRSNGTGVPPVFPALTDSKVAKGDKALLAQLVLAGRNGMPSFRNDLSNEQLADILSYVRSNWGADRSPITAEFIQRVRTATGNEKSENPTMAN